MPTGTVKWFNTTKGYGFIAPEDGSKGRVRTYLRCRTGRSRLASRRAAGQLRAPARSGWQGSSAENLSAADCLVSIMLERPGREYGARSDDSVRAVGSSSPRQSSRHFLEMEAMLPDPRQGGRFPYDPHLYALPAGYFGLLNLHQRASRPSPSGYDASYQPCRLRGSPMPQSPSTPWRSCRGHLEPRLH